MWSLSAHLEKWIILIASLTHLYRVHENIGLGIFFKVGLQRFIQIFAEQLAEALIETFNWVLHKNTSKYILSQYQQILSVTYYKEGKMILWKIDFCFRGARMKLINKMHTAYMK